MVTKLNPWKIGTLTPHIYRKLCKTYALSRFNIPLRGNPLFGRRKVIVGHDGFSRWLKLANKHRKVALVSGFMTSGFLHLGSLTVLRQMAYYQREYGAKVIIPIADLEAICVRHTPESKIKEILIDFLAHFFAAGLSPEKTVIYLQTKNATVLREASLFTSKIDFPVLEKVYNRKLSFGEAYSSLVMAADILYPQSLGCESTLINLGIDEISHFVLVKELISRLGKQFKYPSITYSKILTGLNGSKMGKSIPRNSILLSDSAKVVVQKLQQLKKCKTPLFANTAFNILEWYCEDDALLKRITTTKNLDNARQVAIDAACLVAVRLLDAHQKAYAHYLPIAKKMTEDLMR